MTHVFHGSPFKNFEIVEPRRNIRSKEDCGVRNVIFDDVSFHATPHRWIALSYMYHPSDKYNMGVSLYENTREVAVIGSGSLEEALKTLYGRGGYLYVFEASTFFHVEGLGPLEVITRERIKPLEIQWIADPVQELQKEGVTFRLVEE